MARQYMTDGQFEEYCKRVANTVTAQLELMVPRLLPFALKMNYANCDECGAVMIDPDKHRAWHQSYAIHWHSVIGDGPNTDHPRTD